MIALPRRQRRIFDRPKYDLDITNYHAWRVYDRKLMKEKTHDLVLSCKIKAAPKDVQKVFGIGATAYRNDGKATYEYDFEDNDFSIFLVYDYKATTQFWGENLKDFNYDK